MTDRAVDRLPGIGIGGYDRWAPMESRRRADHLNEVVNALRRITQALRLSSSIVQDTLGITGAQLFVLQQIAECPGASLRELADRTLTDQSSVSVVVSRLVDAGHVARRTSQADGRRTELTLTDTGRGLLDRAPALAQSRLVAALRAIPSSRLRVAASVLERAARAINPTSAPTEMFFEPAAGKRRGAAPRRPPGRGSTR
jgi:DNA-binding MarR family transcriptional regulator